MKDIFNFIDSFPEAVAIYDDDCTPIRENLGFKELFSKINHCEEEIFRIIREAFSSEKCTKKTVGESVTAEVKVSAPFEFKEKTAVAVVLDDITERTRLENTRNELMGNVSHEFRTPLSIIKGAAELLSDDALETEEDKHRYYEKILSEATALEKLAGDLLDRAKLKAGKIKLHTAPLDIDGMLEDIMEKMKFIAAKKNIALEFYPTGVPETEADYDRLRQVAIIFIDNAIKFTDENGVITVGTHFDGEFLHISFTDSGRGIPEEDLPYVFERFYKVDRSQRTADSGSGLGLSIAWNIVQLHGGTIKINSKLGEGTTFTVTVPYGKTNENA